MDLTGQQQPSATREEHCSDFDKIFADTVNFSYQTSDSTSNSLAPNTSVDADIDALINAQPPDDGFVDLDIIALIESCDTESWQLRSTFVENQDVTRASQFDSMFSVPGSTSAGHSPAEPRNVDNTEFAQNYFQEQHGLLESLTTSCASPTTQCQSTTVVPFSYEFHSGDSQPYTTAGQMQHEFAYHEQFLEYEDMEPKKIQIKTQPRKKFRPRTENESKTSSHYLRCEEDVKPEYPTIAVQQDWRNQSDVNIIELTLLGIDKLPHPYILDNKTKLMEFSESALIFKQDELNTIYFQLTEEDFRKGHKSFMVELIKRKQNDEITKELIRSRQLENSMLRFARIYQGEDGKMHRDDHSEEFSTVMTEAYGDVDVEHMGPRYGPMGGQEMVYAVLKGRILRNDIRIDVMDRSTRWHHHIDVFTKNGNVIYFLMPAYPHPQLGHATAEIVIYYKDDELFRSTYLYRGSLDQDLAALRLSDPITTADPTPVLNPLDPLTFMAATGAFPKRTAGKATSTKTRKRLSH